MTNHDWITAKVARMAEASRRRIIQDLTDPPRPPVPNPGAPTDPGEDPPRRAGEATTPTPTEPPA